MANTSDRKKIFLTFDDGPVPGPTEFVLDILKQHRIKATFFCIGDNVRRHPDVFQRVVNEGHRIGNHTFNHLKGWSNSTPDYLTNVKQCEKQFELSSIEHPVSSIQHRTSSKLFRPPYGRIKRSQIDGLNDYQIIMWDVLTCDYDKDLHEEKCLRGSIRATRPGSVVVFHDSLKAEKNMNYVLPRYIDHFLKEGYTFEVIS